MSFLAGFYGAKALQEQENNKAWKQLFQEDRRLDIEQEKLDWSKELETRRLDFQERQHDETLALNQNVYELDLRRFGLETLNATRDSYNNIYNGYMGVLEDMNPLQLGSLSTWYAEQSRAQRELNNFELAEELMSRSKQFEIFATKDPFDLATALEIINVETSLGGAVDQNGNLTSYSPYIVDLAFQVAANHDPDIFGAAIQEWNDGLKDVREGVITEAENNRRLREQLSLSLDESQVEVNYSIAGRNVAETEAVTIDNLWTLATQGPRFQILEANVRESTAEADSAEALAVVNQANAAHIEEFIEAELLEAAARLTDLELKNDFFKAAFDDELKLLANEVGMSDAELEILRLSKSAIILAAHMQNELTGAQIDQINDGIRSANFKDGLSGMKFITDLIEGGFPELFDMLSDEALEALMPGSTADGVREMARDAAQEYKDKKDEDRIIENSLKRADIEQRQANSYYLRSQADNLNRPPVNMGYTPGGGSGAGTKPLDKALTDAYKAGGYSPDTGRSTLDELAALSRDVNTLTMLSEEQDPEEQAKLMFELNNTSYTGYNANTLSSLTGGREALNPQTLPALMALTADLYNWRLDSLVSDAVTSYNIFLAESEEYMTPERFLALGDSQSFFGDTPGNLQSASLEVRQEFMARFMNRLASTTYGARAGVANTKEDLGRHAVGALNGILDGVTPDDLEDPVNVEFYVELLEESFVRDLSMYPENVTNFLDDWFTDITGTYNPAGVFRTILDAQQQWSADKYEVIDELLPTVEGLENMSPGETIDLLYEVAPHMDAVIQGLAGFIPSGPMTRDGADYLSGYIIRSLPSPFEGGEELPVYAVADMVHPPNVRDHAMEEANELYSILFSGAEGTDWVRDMLRYSPEGMDAGNVPKEVLALYELGLVDLAYISMSEANRTTWSATSRAVRGPHLIPIINEDALYEFSLQAQRTTTTLKDLLNDVHINRANPQPRRGR